MVLAARAERRGVEAIDGSPVRRLEGEVHVRGAGGRHRRVADEQLVRPEEALALALDLAADRAERRVVEAPAGGEIAGDQVHMVDQAAAVQLLVSMTTALQPLTNSASMRRCASASDTSSMCVASVHWWP